jgi:hypothetical protein
MEGEARQAVAVRFRYGRPSPLELGATSLGVSVWYREDGNRPNRCWLGPSRSAFHKMSRLEITLGAPQLHPLVQDRVQGEVRSAGRLTQLDHSSTIMWATFH